MFQLLATTRAGCRRGFPRHLLHRIAALAKIALVAFIPQLICTQQVSGKPSHRPNIVLILTDDLGYGNLGCYGQQYIQTPALDQMAREGLRFTRFYAGASLCLPARCTLMSGLHTGHSRCRVNGGGGKHPPIAEEDTTLATVMQAAGYRTAMTGKWALGDHFLGCVIDHQNEDGPGAIYKHGWDYYFGEPNQTYNHRYFPPQLYRFDPHGWIGPRTEGQRLDVVPLKNDAKGKSGEQYSHDLLTENALSFIRAAKNEPFFLYVPYTIPHADFIVPELEPYTRDQSWPDGAKVFASMISCMDRDVGRILDLLEELQLDENTLVVFTSDNGGLSAHDNVFQNNGGLEGYKGSLTEGGLRVPCIARWPGKIQPGRESDELLAFWDFMPTFAELACIEPPTPIDGISFVPTLLDSGEQTHHRNLFFTASDKSRRYYIVRGEGETRSDEEIFAASNSEVIVPKFKRLKRTRPPKTESEVSFLQHRIGNFRSEACGVADFNGDERLDIVAGPYLYPGPDFKPIKIRELDGSVDEQGKGYYDDFANLPLDVDRDGKPDIVSACWFSESVVWFQNKLGQPGLWPEGGREKHSHFEAADLVDLDGDGQTREVLPHGKQTLWCEPAKGADGKCGLAMHVISAKEMSFGGGVGDINGDGRPDVLRPEAWFEAPEDPRKGVWAEHSWAIGAANGKSTHTPQMLVYDVDADGLGDVISSHAHGQGIYWYKQVLVDGHRTWQQNLIDDSWTQPHSLQLADLDADGDLDLIAGKRFMAHNGGDPGAFEPPAIYWYQLKQSPAPIWQRRVVTEGQGIGSGMSIHAIDLDDDTDLDLVVTGKWGGPVWFENRLKSPESKDSR